MPNASNEMSLGKMVMLLVADLHSHEIAIPFRNQKPWHLLYYTLKMEPDTAGKPQFLNELVFDWDGPYPKCEELSECLNGLHMTANVYAHNPRFDVISVDDEDAARWSRDLEELEPGSKSFIEHAAELARAEFVPSQG